MDLDSLINRSISLAQQVGEKRRKRGFDIQKRQTAAMQRSSNAAMLQAKASQQSNLLRFGSGGIERQNLQVSREELARRFPYGLPATQAGTARLTARGYAGSAISGAKTAADRLALEREESMFSRKYLNETGVLPENAVGQIRSIAEKTAKPGKAQCPKGYYHNGVRCVRRNPNATGSW